MKNWFFGAFSIVHGLVHLWYVVLLQGLVEFTEDMAWTGNSWILSSFLGESSLKLLASSGYSLSTLGFVVGGGLILMGNDIWRTFLLTSAVLSSLIIVLFWDGNLSMIIEKGLIGLLINLAIIYFIQWMN